jgi:hypothetical protein
MEPLPSAASALIGIDCDSALRLEAVLRQSRSVCLQEQ